MTTARTSGRCQRRTQGVVPHPKTRRTNHIHTSLQGFPQLYPDKHSDLPGFRARAGASLATVQGVQGAHGQGVPFEGENEALEGRWDFHKSKHQVMIRRDRIRRFVTQPVTKRRTLETRGLREALALCGPENRPLARGPSWYRGGINLQIMFHCL
jgi:hypothetical protein